MICLISFSKFSDALPAFNCTRAIGNLYLRVNILIPLPFCCSSKLMIFSTILTTFSFSGISFMLISFINLINSLIMKYLILSGAFFVLFFCCCCFVLFLSALNKSCAKYDGF